MPKVITRIAPRLLAVSIMLTSVCAAKDLVIDGSSDATFQESHERLLASLSSDDQLKFAVAEAIYLNPFPCLKAKAPFVRSEPVPTTLGGPLAIKACRKELDGKTFNDIMRLAYPPNGQPPKPANADRPVK